MGASEAEMNNFIRDINFTQYQNNFKMSYRNKKQPISLLDKRWGLSKSRNVPRLNKSLNKTVKSRFSIRNTTIDASPSKIQTIKTLPTQYDRSPSPEIKLPAKSLTLPKENPQTPPLTFNYSSIQQVEAKIDLLLEQKLKKLVAINKHKFFNKTRNVSVLETDLADSIVRLNNEIQFLVGNLKTNLHDPRIDCNYEKWGELDKKIKMVEKVMAENGSEVEIMKKYYTKVSHNVTTYRSFCHEPHSVIITKIKEALTSPKVKRFSSTPTSRLPSDSINRTSYKLPDVEAYQKYRYRQPRPSFDQPIIQRSAYQTSYRQFPPQLALPVTRKHSSLSIRPPSRNQTSSYKDQFKPLKETPVNFKELDCYKDKFRNLKVNYENKEQPQLARQIAKYISLQRVQSRNSLKQMEPKIRVQTLPTPRSTTHLDYNSINIRDRRICSTKPKNSRLESLRTNFKRLINQ